MRVPPVYCRLTVLTPGSHADVALPVDVSVADLVPMLMELLGEQGDPGRPVPWRLTGPIGGALRRTRRWTTSASRRGAAAARPGGPASAAAGVRRSRRRAGGAHRALCRSPSAGSARRAHDRAGRRRARRRPAAGRRGTHRLRLDGCRARWCRRGGGDRLDGDARPARERPSGDPPTSRAWHWSPPSARYRSPPQPAGPPCQDRRAPHHCWRLRWRPGPRPRSPRSPPGRWSPHSSAPAWSRC